MSDDSLLQTLPMASRLAMSYAPAAVRSQTLGLLALDARLAGVLRHSREPMLAQLRFSWWREVLAGDSTAWPEGEPLLGLLRGWDGNHAALVALVDGWEALTGPAPLDADALGQMAAGRGAAFAGLAVVAGRPDAGAAAAEAGRRWALADLATRLAHPRERETAARLAAESGPAPRLPRALRPVMVLDALARRRRMDEQGHSPRALLAALRIGLLGV